MRSPKLAVSRNLFTKFMRQLGYADASRLLNQQTLFNKMSRLILRTPCFLTSQLRKIVLIPIIAAFVGMTGCSNMAMQKQGLSISPVNFKPSVTHDLRHDVTQVGRYSTIKNKATAPQQDPLLAISQFKFNSRVKTVGQAIEQVLRDTGYALVPSKQLPHSVRAIQSKPLPITQRELGPISVGNALRILMGDEVFTLVVDPVHRLVTFKLKSKFSHLRGVG